MESVFDYRDYTVHELIDILTRKNIYFSRRNSYAAIAREAPTVISILKDSSDIANYPSGDIVVAASCYSNCENIVAILQLNGYNKELSETNGWHKEWNLPIHSSLSSLALLQKIMELIEVALDSLPFDLYQTDQYKMINNYYQYLRFSKKKIDY